MTRQDPGPVWLITGGSSALGQALARAALSAGSRVVLTDCAPNSTGTLRSRAPEQLLTLALDTTNFADTAVTMERAIRQFGRIDVLVNLADRPPPEVNPHTLFRSEFWDSPHMTRSVLPVMRGRRSGLIVNVAPRRDTSGVIGPDHLSAQVGVFSAALAREVGGLGVRVLLVERRPGKQDTAAPEVNRPEASEAGTPEPGTGSSARQPHSPDLTALAILTAADRCTGPLTRVTLSPGPCPGRR